MEEKKIKAVWYASIVIYGITLLYSFWKNMQTEDWHSVGMAFVAMLTPSLLSRLCFDCFGGNQFMKFISFPMVLPILPASGEVL